jgi:hypothetical protein
MLSVDFFAEAVLGEVIAGKTAPVETPNNQFDKKRLITLLCNCPSLRSTERAHSHFQGKLTTRIVYNKGFIKRNFCPLQHFVFDRLHGFKSFFQIIKIGFDWFFEKLVVLHKVVMTLKNLLGLKDLAGLPLLYAGLPKNYRLGVNFFL